MFSEGMQAKLIKRFGDEGLSIRFIFKTVLSKTAVMDR
jgi:hypothetical protein